MILTKETIAAENLRKMKEHGAKSEAAIRAVSANRETVSYINSIERTQKKNLSPLMLQVLSTIKQKLQ